MISVVEQQPAGSDLDLVQQVENIFSPSGLLSRAKNFEYRPEQQQMAVAVARALEQRDHLAVEAGTGVGKSLAYLVPAILFAKSHSRKAVISTHTINLQEQLTQKDLPMLEAVLPLKFAFTMLKGRGNYLCSRRLHKAMLQADQLFTSPEIEELRRIYEWSRRTEDGSLSDFARLFGARALFSQDLRLCVGVLKRQRDLLLPARAPQDSLRGCPRLESHSVFHPVARRG
jgi:ATP-dependent DNA helicase DinG